MMNADRQLVISLELPTVLVYPLEQKVRKKYAKSKSVK